MAPATASLGIKKIKELLLKHPYNLAIHAGANNMIIVDIDTKDGVAWFNQAIKDHPEWFDTPIDFSGYKDDDKTYRGIHIYLSQPDNPIGGFNTKFGEVRCGDQYAVISPSKHYSGIRYESYYGHSFTEKALQKINNGFLSFLKDIASKETPKTTDKNDPEIKRMLDSPITKLEREAFIIVAEKRIKDQYLLNLLTIEPYEAENIPDHSGKLHYLEHKLAHWIHYETACTLLWNCALNKFKGRSEVQGMRQLREETFDVFVEEGVSPIQNDAPIKKMGLITKSIGEMFANPPEPAQWLVKGWWWSRSLGYISGPSKTGKTIIGNDFAVSVASGKPFLNKYEVEIQGAVLIVQNENSERTVYDRLRKICHSKGLTSDEISKLPLYMCNNQSVMLDNKLDIALLEQKIKETKCVLCQLDPLYMMVNGSLSKDEYMIPILHELTELKNRTGIAFQITTHNRKSSSRDPTVDAGDNMNGTMFQRANHECAWFLRKIVTPPTEEELLQDEDSITIKTRPIELTIEREFRDGGKPFNRDLRITLGEPGELGYTVEDITSGKEMVTKKKAYEADHDRKLREEILRGIRHNKLISVTKLAKDISSEFTGIFARREVMEMVRKLSNPDDPRREILLEDNPLGSGQIMTILADEPDTNSVPMPAYNI